MKSANDHLTEILSTFLSRMQSTQLFKNAPAEEKKHLLRLLTRLEPTRPTGYQTENKKPD